MTTYNITKLIPGCVLAAAVALTINTSGYAAEKSMDGKEFAKKAAQGGMTEVKLGEMAKDKAESPDVKKFGEMMVEDHSKANEQLKKIAADKGIELPTELDKEHQAMVDKMSKLSGKEFDQAYVNGMVEDHKKDVAEFQEASKEISDPEIKAFAAKTVPTLKKHLRKIEAIQRGMK